MYVYKSLTVNLIQFNLFFKYRDIAYIFSKILSRLINIQHIHIDFIKSYYMWLNTNNSSALLIIVIHFLSCYFCVFILEVVVNNVIAYSIYNWLGFRLIVRRLNYYDDIFYDFSSAYSLSNYKCFSKNMLRRCLFF